MQYTAPDSASLSGEYAEALVGEILQMTSDENKELNEWQTNTFVKMCLETTLMQYSQYSVGSHTHTHTQTRVYIFIYLFIFIYLIFFRVSGNNTPVFCFVLIRVEPSYAPLCPLF
jgi:hypothetical protein